MAAWRTPNHLRDHFIEHGRQLGCRTATAYDISAQATLAVGRYFEYEDPATGEVHLGCYDPFSRRFVALTDADEIVTHYTCSVRYVRGLPLSNYDDER